MPEARLRMTQSEWDELEKRSKSLGYFAVTDYIRSLAFPAKVDYAKKWQEVVAAIGALPSDTEFRLRDLIACPPARFGVYLHEQAGQLGITKIERDREGVWKWRKN